MHYAQNPITLPPSTAETIIGHGLHAIVSTLPQPLQEANAVFAANCEIYNWKELAKEHKLTVRNDAELLFKLLQKEGIEKTLPKIRGVYAFVYLQNNTLYLVRDILGIKPLFYEKKNGFRFASEKKVLSLTATELNPRTILAYNLKTKKLSTKKRPFFALKPLLTKDILNQVEKKLKEAVMIRIPEQKFALLFSGGLDSVLIAKYLQESGKDFTCYTAATDEKSPDLLAAKAAAKEMKLKLKYTLISKEETKKYLQKIIPLIEDNNVVKVGVALPLYIAAEQAQKDANKVIFSGSGADELFAGYHRYKASALDKLNKDCYSDILKIYERNCYRDDVITMNNNLELRVPFLDKELVALTLRIPPEWKLHEGTEKYILREIAKQKGIPTQFAERKKVAAQYGSGFDKILEKLAKEEKKNKSAYLAQFSSVKNLKLGALISGGKDSLLAAYIMKQQNYELSCLITIKSKNTASYMFHTPNIHLAELQAEAMQVPIIIQETKGNKEGELKDLEKALKEAKKKYKIEGVISGALYSNYQRERIERIADKLGLKIFSPLWHMDQEKELQQLLDLKFHFILSAVAAEGLNHSWLGREITKKDLENLKELNKKYGINIAGEGGEYESLVLNCPLFHKKVQIKDAEIIMENENTGVYKIKKAALSLNRCFT
ncbi:diphthine--ammonia ligase [Candidatus Woesearchaeota archaeon]|nr:diphthine--ammonia ligase [Candidatus Woesearchaeota archaeon]